MKHLHPSNAKNATTLQRPSLDIELLKEVCCACTPMRFSWKAIAICMACLAYSQHCGVRTCFTQCKDGQMGLVLIYHALQPSQFKLVKAVCLCS